MNTKNPLQQYIKYPVLSINLPTNGILKYTTKTINIPDTTVCNVSARSAKDELLFNNPDALMSGYAIKSVIENCVEEVKDANGLYVPDVLMLLIAIRLASKEKEFEITTTCPECNKLGMFVQNLEYLAQTNKLLEEQVSLTMENGLVLYFKPLTWGEHCKMQNKLFLARQSARNINEIDKDNITTEQLKVLSDTFDTIAEVQFSILIDMIDYIELPDSVKVTDKKFILEWAEELSKDDIELIVDTSNKYNEIGAVKEMDVICSNPECNHEWTLEDLTYDPTSFFTQGFLQLHSMK